jgi:hypothetical protein
MPQVENQAMALGDGALREGFRAHEKEKGIGPRPRLLEALQKRSADVWLEFWGSHGFASGRGLPFTPFGRAGQGFRRIKNDARRTQTFRFVTRH